jgi:hypothetical protein
MSWRTDDDRALLRTFEEWRRAQPDPDAMPPGELVEMFMAERESK